MKALDFLQLDEVQPKCFTVVTGEDIVIKRQVVEKLKASITCDDTEIYDLKDAGALAPLLDTVSLFGSRLLLCDLAKWGSLTELRRVMSNLNSGDYFIIKAVDSPPKLEFSFVQIIDCPVLSQKKSKEKFLKICLSKFNLTATEHGFKRLLDRCDDSAAIESTIRILSFALSGNNVTQPDVDRATKDLGPRKDFSRSLLRKNTIKLSREILEVDVPVYALTVLHTLLLKIYTYLEMISAGLEEDKIFLLIKVSPRSRRDWRLLPRHYSSKAIRKVLEATNEAYQSVISGREWVDRLLHSLSILN